MPAESSKNARGAIRHPHRCRSTAEGRGDNGHMSVGKNGSLRWNQWSLNGL